MIRVRFKFSVRVRFIARVIFRDVFFCVVSFILYFSCYIFHYYIYILDSELTITMHNLLMSHR